MLLFAYGTLMDTEVRAVVVGRSAPAIGVGRLHGYRRYRVAGERYPMILPEEGGLVEGLLVPLAGEIERDRIRWFEGERQVLAPVPVQAEGAGSITALACLSAPELLPAGEWDPDAWRRLHKDAYLAATRLYMDGFGRVELGSALAAWAAAHGDRS